MPNESLCPRTKRYERRDLLHLLFRYGPHGNPVERGEVVPGSYCSRDFEACHRRRCKIQSPNYPGLFPRNVTCHFTIRHRDKAPCKHIVIQVGQLKSHKVQLKTPSVGFRHGMFIPPGGIIPSSSSITQQQQLLPQQQSLLLQEDALVSWEDCAMGNRDSLTFHDGNSILDPVLLVICGGGYVPQVTSSSSEMLVVFRATPYGNPMEQKPSPPFPEPLRGFELDVDVITVDSDTADYSNFKDNCTFYVSQVKVEADAYRSSCPLGIRVLLLFIRVLSLYPVHQSAKGCLLIVQTSRTWGQPDYGEDWKSD
jgi:hypothetical protein